MHCSDFLARYTDYDDSLASAAEQAEFRAHMEVCPRCARYDRVLRKGRMVARQIPGPEPSTDFIPNLELVLEEEPVVPPTSRPRSLAASGAVMVALVLALVAGRDLLSPSGSTAAAAVPHDHAAAWTESGAGTAMAETARPLTLPAAALEDPAGWTAGRVDRSVASSYSPLVIGPPAYRAPRTVTLTSTMSSRRTLD